MANLNSSAKPQPQPQQQPDYQTLFANYLADQIQKSLLQDALAEKEANYQALSATQTKLTADYQKSVLEEDARNMINIKLYETHVSMLIKELLELRIKHSIEQQLLLQQNINKEPEQKPVYPDTTALLLHK